MFVKICGITRPGDAVAAVDAGADAIGLNFVPASRRVVDVEVARAIREVIPCGVMAVGIFQGHSIEEISGLVGELRLDAAQLHTPSPAVAEVAAMVPRVITVTSVDSGAVGPIDDGADVVMVDGPAPGSGVAFDWSVIGGLTAERRVLLAGGLRPDNVAAAIHQVRPWGVDVASGVELEPGIKDAVAMTRFVAEARVASPRAS
jgi:phosphoribosylanthranilate isomerase